MAIPDPESFFGRKCLIKLKAGNKIIKTVDVIDKRGVIVKEHDGATTTIPFAEIAEVSLAR